MDKYITMVTGRVANIMFALPMLVFGAGHFMAAKGMAAMVPLPGGIFWVYLTGVALIAGGLGIIINKMARLAAFLLGVMIFIFAFSLHLPPMLEGNQGEMMQFMKDVMIASGAWAIAGKLKT
ncbi:MAG: DoxX family protein [Leptospirales bacterium]